MKLASLFAQDRPLIAAFVDGEHYDLTAIDPGLGQDIGAMLALPDWRARAQAALEKASALESDGLRFRPVVPRPPKLLCLGLNNIEHAREAKLAVPLFPEIFARVASSLIGHNEPMLRPEESEMLDYEVELAVIIGHGGRRIQEDEALAHVAGYAVFNDGSVRDYQVRTNQWTLGKNFHGTGALGPYLVTCDEVPEGAKDLRMTTRVGDEVLQDGSTSDMIFDVARTIALLSEAVLFEPGDVIAMGTPSGIGHARKPQRYLKPGEVCRAGIEGLGEIANPIQDDPGDESAPEYVGSNSAYSHIGG